jgi:hypothetical protein
METRLLFAFSPDRGNGRRIVRPAYQGVEKTSARYDLMLNSRSYQSKHLFKVVNCCEGSLEALQCFNLNYLKKVPDTLYTPSA